MLHWKRMLDAKPAEHEPQPHRVLTTTWGDDIIAAREDEGFCPLSDHPHPQFARDTWTCLNGWWDYAIVEHDDAAADDAATLTAPASYDGRILVPFSPEALLSGVSRTLQPGDFLWYHRTLPAVAREDGQRCLLHFEAVDWACACFVNGTCVGAHEGGYLPFSFDITDMLGRAGEDELALCVTDPSDAGTQLRGKQTLVPGDIWTSPQSGIWQTAWLEVVPAERIEDIRTTVAIADDGSALVSIAVKATCAREVAPTTGEGVGATGESVAPAASEGVGAATGVSVVSAIGEGIEASAALTEGSCALEIALPDPHLWSPDDPFLYEFDLRLGNDVVHSYFAVRTCDIGPGDGFARFRLNGQPLLLRGVLDQGHWPDGLLTAPSDEALVFDIQAMKDAGFNLLRKHIKVESDRWYYHCDRLGMLVWQDVPTGGSEHDTWTISYQPSIFRSSWQRFDDTTPAHLEKLSSSDVDYRREWAATCKGMIAYLANHPCIVTWVLFNEGWGQFESQRAANLARSLDSTRPIDAVSGWYDQGAGDWLDVHNYFRDHRVWRDRFVKRTGCIVKERAYAIGEFGGLTYCIPEHSSLASAYGYLSFDTIEDWHAAFTQNIAQVNELWARGLSAWVYTQLSDVEEETNGLLTYDRRVNKLKL